MSRKYRHQGYQNAESENSRTDRKRPPAQSLTTEERIQRRSLRHATAREAKEVVRCHHCGRDSESLGAITAETICLKCRAPLHCCRTCRHFDSAARWQCRAEIPEAVADKSKANHCLRYEPRLVLDTTGRRSDPVRGDGGPKAQFDNLFKR